MSTKLTPCGERGMPVAAAQYHPYAACLMFRRCHNSSVVEANLTAVINHGIAIGIKKCVRSKKTVSL